MAVTNKRGIFSLFDVSKRQAAGTWGVSNETWLSGTEPYTASLPFGYTIAGAIAPGITWVSTIDRIDYSNDTATALTRGNTGPYGSVSNSAAVGSPTFGYFAGGNYSSSQWRTNIMRLDFDNDTAATSPKGPLSETGRHNMAASANSTYAVFIGGATPASGISKSMVDRFTFANDTLYSGLNAAQPTREGVGHCNAANANP